MQRFKELFRTPTRSRKGQSAAPSQWKAVERGFCLGAQRFREELLEQMRGKAGEQAT